MQKFISKLLIVSTLVFAPLATVHATDETPVASIEVKEADFGTTAVDPGGNGGVGG